MPNKICTIETNSFIVDSFRNCFRIVLFVVMFCHVSQGQEAFRILGETGKTPRKLSRSIVKAAKRTSTPFRNATLQNDATSLQGTESEQAPDAKQDRSQQEPRTQGQGYVNPIFQGFEIEGVELGFSPIQTLNTSKPIESGEPPKDHANTIFSNQETIAYQAGSVDSSRFQQQVRTAATFQHQPLYFEELNSERHGKSLRSLQPIVSGAKFFGTLPLLPYKMATQRPGSHTRTHDPFPAGVPAPRVRESKRFSPKAATFEVVAIAAAIMIIP